MNKLFTLVLLIMSTLTMYAQEPKLQLVSTAGDSYQNNSYQMDWSVGEIAIQTLSGSSFIITQGFHQGQLKISTLINNTDFKITMKVFPNPTSSYINLTANANETKLDVTITTLTGKIIYKGILRSNNWQFDFSKYTIGTYIILVSDNKQILKSFKVIKQ